MNRIRRSWDLVKSSWSVLMSDRELLLYPVLSGVVTIAGILALAGIYLLGTGNSIDEVADKASDSGGGWTITDVVVLFLMYFVSSLIITFFNAALISGALKRLRGGDPTFKEGLSEAGSQIGPIVGYAAIAATVGLVVSFLRSKNSTAANIGAGVLGAAWGVMTFLVVPVLVAEKIGPADAVKRSAALLKKTWGEQIVGNSAIGLIGLGVGLVVVVIGGLLVAGASSLDSNVAMGGAIVLIAIAVAIVAVVFTALSSIYKAAVYEFAAEDTVAPQFGADSLQTAFRVK